MNGMNGKRTLITGANKGGAGERGARAVATLRAAKLHGESQ
jgi:hypothetical protein